MRITFFANRCYALLLASCLCAPLAQAAPLPSFVAEYSVLRDGSALGRATLTYQRKGNNADFLTHIEGTAGLAALAGADIREHSVLLWHCDIPETSQYDYRMKLAWKQRERRIDIDAKAGTITSIDKGQRYDFPYQKGILDRHSVTLAIMQALSSGARGELVFAIVDRGKLENHRFTVAGEETLDTARGPRAALRIERVRESADGKATTLWLDREHGLLPLKILQTEADGERLELRINASR